MAADPKRPKQKYVANHYVSKCYLRGFLDPAAKKEKVWAYGRFKGATEVTANLMSISETALVNNLYGTDDTERVQLEAQFKIAEDLFPPIRAKLNSHGKLSKIEVGILIYCPASTWCGIPAGRLITEPTRRIFES